MLAKKLFLIPLSFYLVQSATANQPTCSNMVGTWVNQVKSTLTIKSVDPHTGKMSGDYISAEGTKGQTYEVSGWVNNQLSGKKKDSVHPIAFSVNWGDYGSIASWSGYCYLKDEMPTIQTVWHLTKADSNYRWDHISTNSDIFTPE